MSLITDVHGREILDSRGNPTLEVTIRLASGIEARASVPSGTSRGSYEAYELRDGDTQRYNGLGVLKALRHIEHDLQEVVLGMDVFDQKAIDVALCKKDGTENKSRLGANAILGVSLAVARAAALEKRLPLYTYIAELCKKKTITSFPLPVFNILNGGKHSDAGLSVQEFKIFPVGRETYPDQLQAGSEIFHALRKVLTRHGFATTVGDEGGFAPHVENHNQAFELLQTAIADAGYTLGKNIFLGLDIAANSFYETQEQLYLLRPENVKLTRESLINVYKDWIRKYAVVSIEDGLEEGDFDGWHQLQEKLLRERTAWSRPALIIGDDLLVTNIKRVRRAIAANACNTVLIKPNQIGTLTETLACIRLAHKHRLECMISHRSGDTVDDFIADLAVGSGAEFIKSGSLSRGERLAKYNRLLEIWEEINNKN